MSRKVRIAYNGPALSNGEMDVRDLAPALLAFADLVNKANTIIGGEHAVKVLLNQDSIQKGSFDVTMLLDMNVLDQARLLVGVANDNGLSELLTVLGWGETVVGATVPVVAGIFSWFRQWPEASQHVFNIEMMVMWVLLSLTIQL